MGGWVGAENLSVKKASFPANVKEGESSGEDCSSILFIDREDKAPPAPPCPPLQGDDLQKILAYTDWEDRSIGRIDDTDC